jgi:hypothetical protein
MEEKTRVKETLAEDYIAEQILLTKHSWVSFRGVKVVPKQENLASTQVFPTSNHGFLVKYAVCMESTLGRVRFAVAVAAILDRMAIVALQTALIAVRKRPPLPIVQGYRVPCFASS